MKWNVYIAKYIGNGEYSSDKEVIDIPGTSSSADKAAAIAHVMKLYPNVEYDKILCLPSKD